MPTGISKRIENHRSKRSEAAIKNGIGKWFKIRFLNESHPQWKGDKVKYRTLHSWVTRKLGQPQKCENLDCIYPRKRKGCPTLEKPKIFDWANISGEYKRDLNDWVRLCRSCHMLYDRKKLEI